MRKLIYSMGVSLDGFISGPDGDIEWSAPDEELHRFHNEQTRKIGVHLCGRGLYEVMVYWETAHEDRRRHRWCGNSLASGRSCRRSCSPRRSRPSRATPDSSESSSPTRSSS